MSLTPGPGPVPGRGPFVTVQKKWTTYSINYYPNLNYDATKTSLQHPFLLPLALHQQFYMHITYVVTAGQGRKQQALSSIT